ncbi:retrovirus-related pol polyprotein from transposon TNT 1-94 [Tanacetum coccineum]
MFHRPLILLQIVQLILFIVDSGCTKHMTGNLKLLCNFVEKFLGTVRFGNDQFAPILGYGDLNQGNIMIKRVYYIEGLNHNLFSVGQFCDADLEDATINGKKYILVIVDDYSRYTWTLFLRSKDETPEVLKDFLTMIQRNLQAQVISVRTDRGTKFLNKTLHAYFKEEGIEHQTSTPRTPKQNGVAPDYDNSDPVPSIQNVVPIAEKTDSSHQGLEFLFSPLIEEYYTPTHSQAEENNNDQAPNASFQEDEFINPFYTRVQEFVSIVEPKNIKEAMANSAWIEAMQEEFHQFDRLKVWELVDKPFGKMIIKLKWLWKNKKDEDQTEEVYVAQPEGLLIDSSRKSLPSRKALYGLKASSKSLILSREPIDQSDYHSKIGSLMYLTSSRPDLVQAVCYCARYQA